MIKGFYMRSNVVFSHSSDDWATPKFIYYQAMKKGMFDPCPLLSTFDGLSIEWWPSNFVNPPYSQLRKWVKKSIEQNQKGKKVVLLIPARTDTLAFKMLYDYGSVINLITGRLCFGDGNKPAPFPCMIVELVGGGFSSTTINLIDKKDIVL